MAFPWVFAHMNSPWKTHGIKPRLLRPTKSWVRHCCNGDDYVLFVDMRRSEWEMTSDSHSRWLPMDFVTSTALLTQSSITSCPVSYAGFPTMPGIKLDQKKWFCFECFFLENSGTASYLSDVRGTITMAIVNIEHFQPYHIACLSYSEMSFRNQRNPKWSDNRHS